MSQSAHECVEAGSTPQGGDGRSDEAIALAARADPIAFLPLYERYLDRVYRYCRVRLGTPARAEDATSDAFLKAMERLPSYRGGSFVAWLFAITRNVVIDAQRRTRAAAPIESAATLAGGEPGPEGWAVISSRRNAIRSALDRLTEDQRAVIELQLAGWAGPQIADALGKTPAAVKMLRLRSLRRLRELLIEAGWDGGEYLDD